MGLFVNRGLWKFETNYVSYIAAGLPDGLHIFKPKSPIWANFGGPWNGEGWYILWPVGTFYGHLVIL
jgi:hypothetical protein